MKKVLVAFAVSSALTSNVFAEELVVENSKFYVGASIGQTSTDISKDELGFSDEVKLDDTDTAIKLIGGYNINKNFSIEASYNDLGEVKASYENSFSDGIVSWSYQESLTAEASGITLSILGKLPLSESFNLFAKAGMNFWDVEGTYKYSERIAIPIDGIDERYSDSGSDDDDGKDAFFAVGGEYNFSKIAVRLEYEMFTLDDTDVDVISIGATYNF
ncbi:outer membrane beta-barrel protein [Thalassotalea crassostreae]|uniref:outer membrane beta-barrel protein n=1 Tax=Thalassotalea crassostreae TaxID=1763536 RepID=UPI00083955BE|nr:outer membrane beta-barrel protein [Thalassotalea crassostreae]